jgi:hypothetical protein
MKLFFCLHFFISAHAFFEWKNKAKTFPSTDLITVSHQHSKTVNTEPIDADEIQIEVSKEFTFPGSQIPKIRYNVDSEVPTSGSERHWIKHYP